MGFLNLTATNGSTSTITSLATSVAIAATKGNTIIGIVKCGSNGIATSVTDTQGNTWTVDGHSTAAGPTVSVVRSKLTASLTVSDAITANFGSNNTITVVFCEYEGTCNPVDLTYSNNNNGVSITSQTLTASSATTVAPELVIAGIGTGGASSQTTISLSSGTPSTMALRGQGPSTKNFGAMADAMAPATATPSASWSWTTGSTWGGVIFSYKITKTSSGKFFRVLGWD